MSDDEVKDLTAEDFFEAQAPESKRVIIRGGAVYVHELSPDQFIRYNSRIKSLKRKGKKDIDISTSLELMALLISMTVHDKEGNPLFSETDVKRISKSRPDTLITLSAEAMEVSGFKSEQIQEVAANLKKIQSGSSASS